MTTDFRALCAELVDIITAHANPDDCAVGYVAGVLTRARAALADKLATRRFINNPVQIAECGGPCADGGPEACDCGALWCDSLVPAPANGEVAELVAWLQEEADDYESIGNEFAARNLNRAADLLQRRYPQPPAEGEVAELVADLQECADSCTYASKPYWAAPIRRAADLLQHLSPPQPVLASEGLPRPEDCDAEGRCWWFALETEVDFGAWTLGTPEACTGDNWGHTHWLPAHALPVPGAD